MNKTTKTEIKQNKISRLTNEKAAGPDDVPSRQQNISTYPI